MSAALQELKDRIADSLKSYHWDAVNDDIDIAMEMFQSINEKTYDGLLQYPIDETFLSNKFIDWYHESMEESFEQYVQNSLYENVEDCMYQDLYEIIDEIAQDLLEKGVYKQEDSEIVYNALSECVLLETNIDLYQMVCCNLSVANEIEQESRYANTYFLCNLINESETDVKAEDVQNSVFVQLLYQQGHTLLDLYERSLVDYSIRQKSPIALDMFVDEVENNTTGGEEFLTFCLRMSLKELVEIFENKKNIEIEAGVNGGLFNWNQGSGSVLDISLNKPVTIDHDMIAHVQIEGVNKKLEQGYTVNDTYGMSGDFWEKGAKAVNSSSDLLFTSEQQERFAEEFEKLLSLISEQVEQKRAENAPVF